MVEHNIEDEEDDLDDPYKIDNDEGKEKLDEFNEKIGKE